MTPQDAGRQGIGTSAGRGAGVAAGLGAGRFAPAAVTPVRSVPRALGAAAALLVLVVGVPLALGAASGPPPVPTSWPDWHTLARTMGAEQLVRVLVGVVWLLWAQFVVCVLVEVVAAVRGGVLARPVPLAGPTQRLARGLVAALLLTAALATQASAAAGPARAPASISASISASLSASGGGATAAAHAVASSVDGVTGGGAARDPAGRAPTGDAPTGQAGTGHATGSVAAHAPLGHGQLVPADDGEELIGRRVYVVQAPQGRHHESLWEIAERHLGDGRRYQEIYALNHARPQPDGRTLLLARLIQPGWLLVMPEDAVGVERYLPANPASSAVTDPATAGVEQADAAAVAGHGALVQVAGHGASVQAAGHGASVQAAGHGASVQGGSGAHDGSGVRGGGSGAVASAQVSPVMAAELGGSGLLGAGLLALLLAARRRRRGSAPSAAATEAEVWLRVGADVARADWLNRALRGLPAACGEAGVPLPNVYAAVLDEAAVELLVAPPAVRAAAGWTAVAEGSRWRLERSVALPATGDPCPYPALVSLGRDVADRDILLQLGASAGPIAVTGGAAMVTAVTRALAVELATNPWADPLRVTVTELPSVTGELAGPRLEPVGLAEALNRLPGAETGADHGRDDGVLTGRPPAPPGVPEQLVVGRLPDAQTCARLRAAAAAGVGLLVAGELDGSAWRLQVDDAGTLTVPELGIVVSASRLSDETLARLHELIAAATGPDGTGAHPLLPGTPATGAGSVQRAAGAGSRTRASTGRPDVPLAGHGSDDAAWAVARARAGVLGPVLIRAQGRVDAARVDQIAELIVFLALHPGGVHPTVLAGAIWPRGVTSDVRDATVERARDWLGSDEMGSHRLRSDAEGRLFLAPSVVVDLDVLCTLLHRSRTALDARAEADLLARALRLVRGPLVGGIEAGSYAWLARTGLHAAVPALVVDASHRLAELLGDDDPHAATEAARRGLLVDPCDQRLWRDVLRLAYGLGGVDGARTAAREMTLTLAGLGVEPDGPTQALLGDLVPGPAAAGG
jgi:hypothetical protein